MEVYEQKQEDKKHRNLKQQQKIYMKQNVFKRMKKDHGKK